MDINQPQTINKRIRVSKRLPVSLHLFFYLYFSPSPDCHGPCRNKRVTFSIVRKISPEEYIIATFGAFGLLVATYLLVILVSCLLCVRQRRMIPLPPLVDQSDVVDAAASRQQRNLSRYTSISSSGSSLDGDVATRRRPKGTGMKQNL